MRMVMSVRGVIMVRMGMRGHSPSSCEIIIRVNLFNSSLDSLVYVLACETCR